MRGRGKERRAGKKNEKKEKWAEGFREGITTGEKWRRGNPASTHAARHGAAAVHFCRVLVESRVRLHESFITDIVRTRALTTAVLFPQGG